MRTAIILATLTVASPALADGAIVKSCDYSSAGSCPFHGVKGADYLIRARLGQNCGTDNRSKLELVNPAGRVTLAMFLGGTCTGNYSREFRAAFTGTYHLRYVPDEGVPFGAGGAVFTDCRTDSKTRCAVPLGGRRVAGEHSANGDIDWMAYPFDPTMLSSPGAGSEGW